MNKVKVISAPNYRGNDTTIVTLNADKRGICYLDHSIDTIYIVGTSPSIDIGFKSVKGFLKKNGSGCGGPADEGQISFVYKDSTYPLSNYHFVIVNR
jgi:hypothetical protein